MRILIAAALCAGLAGPAMADGHWRGPTAFQQEVSALPRDYTLGFLGMFVKDAGFRCEPSTYRRFGISPVDGQLYYSVECPPWDTYVILIPRDENRSVRVMSCHTFQAMMDMTCDEIDPAEFIP